MNRRETTLALLALGICAGPRVATAQAAQALPKMVTLGLLSNSAAPTTPESDRTPIAAALKPLGWVEGKNLRIEPAYAAGNRERLQALAEELVGKKVDLIYVHGPDAGAAARATRTIPIVFFGPTMPVEMGLVDSYARPGRNVTGVAWSAGIQLYEKLLEFVKELVPTATRVAYLRPGAPGLEPVWWTEATQRLETTATARGLELRAFNVLGPGDFAAAFESIKGWRAQALFCHQTPMFFSARQSTSISPTAAGYRAFSTRATFPRPEGSSATAPTFQSCSPNPSGSSSGSCVAPIPPTCRWRCRRATNCWSTSRPPGRSTSRSRSCFCSAPTG